MLAENRGEIQIAISEETLQHALELYLNKHVFKAPLKVKFISARMALHQPSGEIYFAHEIKCESLLARLGETIH